MAELSDADFERLERYDAGAMSADERAAFEVELRERVELREALSAARVASAALPGLARASLGDAASRALVERALPEPGRRRWLPVAIAAGLIAFAFFRFGVDRVESLGGVVTVDARTMVAGEAVLSGNEVVTGELGAVHVRRRSSEWLVVPSSEVFLRGNRLMRGAVVISGRAPLSVDAHWIEVDGEAVIATEPLEGSFRETSHLERGDVMNPKTIRLAGGVAVMSAVTIYVLSGSAWVTPPDEMAPVRVDAGKTWTRAPPASKPQVRRGDSEFEQWPTDVPRPSGVTERVDAGRPPTAPPVEERPVAFVADATGVPAKPLHPVTRDGIQAAMKEVIPELRDCYDGWVQREPSLGGAIAVAFVIDVDDAGVGAVSGLSIVDGGLGHAALEGCVLNVMNDLSFEPPGSPVNVTYPFNFSPAPPDGGP